MLHLQNLACHFQWDGLFTFLNSQQTNKNHKNTLNIYCCYCVYILRVSRPLVITVLVLVICLQDGTDRECSPIVPATGGARELNCHWGFQRHPLSFKIHRNLQNLSEIQVFLLRDGIRVQEVSSWYQCARLFYPTIASGPSIIMFNKMYQKQKTVCKSYLLDTSVRAVILFWRTTCCCPIDSRLLWCKL